MKIVLKIEDIPRDYSRKMIYYLGRSRSWILNMPRYLHIRRIYDIYRNFHIFIDRIEEIERFISPFC